MSVNKISTSKSGIDVYEIVNANGMTVEIITFGARISKILVNDKNGNLTNVTTGFANPDDYKNENPYFGAIIGRVANRIGNSSFSIDGVTYNVNANEGNNCLHGGKVGFDSRIFNAEIVGENSLRLSYVSENGEEGFPNTLNLAVVYTVNDNNSLSIEYFANADGDTVFSPTNHAYFNLDGDFITSLNHVLYIDAQEMSLTDEQLICDGSCLTLSGTPFDFSTPKKVGKDIKQKSEIFDVARGGYDFNYVLTPNRDLSKPCAYAYSEKTGIKMDVITDRPCIQLYTGNFLDGTLNGNHVYGYQSTICLETQSHPNACNISPNSVILRKGDNFYSKTEYVFGYLN